MVKVAPLDSHLQEQQPPTQAKGPVSLLAVNGPHSRRNSYTTRSSAADSEDFLRRGSQDGGDLESLSESAASMTASVSFAASTSLGSLNDDALSIYSKFFLIRVMEKIPLILKLLIIILTPLCGALALGIQLWIAESKLLSQSSTMSTIIQLSIDLGDYIDAIQVERGLMTKYFNANATQYYSETVAAAKGTDAIQAKLAPVLNSMDWSQFGNETSTTVAAYKTLYFDPMPEIRKKMFAFQAPFQQSNTNYINFYRASNAMALNVVGRLSTLAYSEQIGNKFVPYTLLLRIKESTGLSRGNGYAAFNARRFTSPSSFDTFSQVQATLKSLNDMFTAVALDVHLRKYQKEVTNSKEGLLTSQMATFLLGAVSRTNYNCSSSVYIGIDWQLNMTTVISQIQGVVVQIGNDMQASQNTLLANAIANTVVAVALLVGTLVIVFILSILCSTVILGPWKRLNVLQDRMVKRFVPAGFLSLLGVKNIVELKLGDFARRQLTCLFCDIRDFTTVSESMTPAQTFAFINDFLAHAGPAIRFNQGYIDKYLGDGFFAVFGKAQNAADAAVALQNAVARFNHEHEGTYPQIRLGVGLHTGLAIAGTIGEAERVDGSIVGDTVNLASRVEGLTKHFGALVCITDATLKNLNSEGTAAPTFYTRQLGSVRAKGKAQSTLIYELLIPGFDPSSDAKIISRDEYEKALTLMTQDKTNLTPQEEDPQWNLRKAADILMAITQKNPADKAAQQRLNLCMDLIKEGRRTWSGIEVMNQK